MEASLIVAISAIGGNVLLGGGLALTWIRNGRSSATKYGELKNEVCNLGKDVKALAGVVTSMDGKVDKFQLKTVETIARQGEKITGAEKDIVTIFNTMERRKR